MKYNSEVKSSTLLLFIYERVSFTQNRTRESELLKFLGHRAKSPACLGLDNLAHHALLRDDPLAMLPAIKNEILQRGTITQAYAVYLQVDFVQPGPYKRK